MRAGRQWIWVKATRNALTDPLGMPIDSVKAAALRATSCSLVGRTPSAINADEKNFQAVLAKPRPTRITSFAPKDHRFEGPYCRAALKTADLETAHIRSLLDDINS